MARSRKVQPSLEGLFFSSPEQKVFRLLLAEPTTAFTPRVISSKLKGVRGLGGGEGIMKILGHLEELGLVDFVDNRRAVRLREDCSTVRIMKTFASLCDLEGLMKLIEPHSEKGILRGCRAKGLARSDSEYELFVVTDAPDEVQRTAGSYPLGRKVQVQTCQGDEYAVIEAKNPKLAGELSEGIVMWGPSW